MELTWKEFLEVISTILTIILSSTALYGIWVAHKKGFITALHHLVKHHHEAILRHEQLMRTEQKKNKGVKK